MRPAASSKSRCVPLHADGLYFVAPHSNRPSRGPDSCYSFFRAGFSRRGPPEEEREHRGEQHNGIGDSAMNQRAGHRRAAGIEPSRGRARDSNDLIARELCHRCRFSHDESEGSRARFERAIIDSEESFFTAAGHGYR